MQARDYQRKRLGAAIGSLLIKLAVLAFCAFIAGRRLDDVVRSWTGEGVWLRLVTLGTLYAILLEGMALPIDFWAGYVLEHRAQLSRQTVPGWVWKRIKGYLIGGPIALVILVGFYAFLRLAGPVWWIWATLGWLVVTIGLGRLMPILILPLFYKCSPIDDALVTERVRKLLDGTGLTARGIYRLEIGKETSKANAALAGLGRSRRVLLFDTLLEKFTPDEIEVVLAHEVGHHVYGHLVKRILWSGATTLVTFWLVDLILARLVPDLGYRAWPLPAHHDPAALPLLMLFFTAAGLVLLPLNNALSRRFERQCDRYALLTTGLFDSFRTAFTRLAQMNKADSQPHPLIVWFFYDHPPIAERIAMADAVKSERHLAVKA